MTTQIEISTNGMYVSEGHLNIEPEGGGSNSIVAIKVGPGSHNAPAKQSFHVPHGSTVTLDLKERQATDEEREAVVAAMKDAGNAG